MPLAQQFVETAHSQSLFRSILSLRLFPATSLFVLHSPSGTLMRDRFRRTPTAVPDKTAGVFSSTGEVSVTQSILGAA